jgi:hypothetical protein
VSDVDCDPVLDREIVGVTLGVGDTLAPLLKLAVAVEVSEAVVLIVGVDDAVVDTDDDIDVVLVTLLDGDVDDVAVEVRDTVAVMLVLLVSDLEGELDIVEDRVVEGDRVMLDDGDGSVA